ncbi:MAG: hypothetical protein ACP5VS_15150 [Desulfomonilaceae bacterium]
MRIANSLLAIGIAILAVSSIIAPNISYAASNTLADASNFSGVSVLPVFHGGHGGGGHGGGHYGGGGYRGGGFHHGERGLYGNRYRNRNMGGDGFFWSDIEVDGYPCVWNGYRYKCYDIDDDDYDYD